MALKIAVKEINGSPKQSKAPAGWEVSRNFFLVPKPILKKVALVMIGLGVLIIAYLGWIYISNLGGSGETRGAQVALVPTPFLSPPASFGDLVEDSAWGSEPKTRVSPNPVLGTQDSQILPKRLPLSYFFISIPALQISQAEVIVGVDGTNEEEYGEVLKNSLAHLSGSALPGERGTVFVFGHSTLPIFAKNDYESIFTNLPKLKAGDMVEVNYGGYNYRYIVYKTAVVDPNNLEALSNTYYPRLALMTCIPPGFGTRRFIAIAELE